MRSYCPKCRSTCHDKKQQSVFIEIKCHSCGFSWLDIPEGNKPVTVKEADLLNLGVGND